MGLLVFLGEIKNKNLVFRVMEMEFEIMEIKSVIDFRVFFIFVVRFRIDFNYRENFVVVVGFLVSIFRCFNLGLFGLDIV